MQYRPEIDGLRTVAVVPVILFHAHLTPLPGGFIGVDIFFVISGYLITSLLISDLERGRFSITTFYERRARRILPALFVVMAVSCVFAVLWMFPLELNDFAQSVFATTFFGSNILFWLESGYFSADSELKPLLHTWSLAIEEQYYIFFPLLLAVIWRGTQRFWITTATIVGLTLASFASAILLVHTHPDAAFYLLPTRAWELLVGALVALTLHRHAVAPNAAGSTLGMGLIIAGLLISTDALWPSWLTLLPVMGSALIILFASPTQLVGRVLASPPFVGIGLISYSAYLWHQPLLAFLRLRSPTELPGGAYVAVVVATFGLAYLTWRFVEQPFRARRDGVFTVSRRAIFISSGVVGALFASVAFVVDRTDGLPGRDAPSGRSFVSIVDTVAGGRTAALPCDTDISFKPINAAPIEACVFPATQTGGVEKRAILIGDSHATIMSSALRDLVTDAGYDFSVMTFGGCIPFPGFKLTGRDCNAANLAVYDHLAVADYDLILVAARPQYMFHDPGQNISFEQPGSGTQTQRVSGLVEAGLTRLQELDATVLYFDPVPEMPFDIGQYVRKSYAFGPQIGDIDFALPYATYQTRAQSILDLLGKTTSPRFLRVKTAEILCPTGDSCVGVKGGVAFYTDDNHLSVHGVKLIMGAVSDALER